MFCQNCGTQNTDSSMFCENCGAKLINVTEQAAAPVEEATKTEAPVAETPVTPVQQTAPAGVAPKKPFPVSPLMIVAAVEAIVVIIAAVVFISSIVKANNYEKTACKFWNDLAAGRYEAAYEYLNLDDDETFLSKESFVSAMETNGICEAEKVRIKKSSQRSDKKAVFRVTYEYKEADCELELDLVKEDGKWVVEPEPFIVKDYIVDNVPVDATLYVDGNKISDKFLVDGSERSYKLPKMFAGKHTYYAKKDIFATPEVTTTGKSVYLNSLTLDEKSSEALLKQACETVDKITEAWVTGGEFDAVSKYFTDANSSYGRTNEEKYDAYATYFFLGEDQDDTYIDGKTAVSFSDVEASVGYMSTSNDTVTVSVNYSAKMLSESKDYNGSKKYFYNEKETEKGVSMSLEFVYENGEWLAEDVYNFTTIAYN